MYTKDSAGNLSCVAVKSTDKNYVKLDKSVYNGQNGYYSISAFNNGNGSLITTGPVVLYAPEGTEAAPLICEKKCNGSTYAWKLGIYESAPGNTQMRLNSTLDYYDNVADIAVPFYQAIGDAQYNALDLINHPWTEGTADGISGTGILYNYKHILLTPNTPGGPFRDSQNNVINSGWLVEKKMDQFAYMATSVAVGNPSTSTNCDPNLVVQSGGTWMSYYNTNVDQSSWLQVPASVEPFAADIPTQLECDVIGDVGGGDEIFEEIAVSPCLSGSSSICDYLTCLGIPDETSGCSTAGTGDPYGGVIVGYEIKYLTANKKSIIGYTGEETPKKVGQLKDGLYEIIFFSAGKAFPIIFEQNSNLIIKEDRELVQLTLTPTVVENNLLKFKINSEKNMNVNIKVRSLDGQTFHDENTTLSCSIDKDREVVINASNLPQNQLRITLTFDDGSILQETALKMN